MVERSIVASDNRALSLAGDALSADQLKHQVQLIQQVMASVMTKDEHYGVIPGTLKPTLYKAGAEKLLFTFRLRPIMNREDIEVTELGGGHREYTVMSHIMNQAGEELSTGIGSCSTMESKYRYRKAEQTCPQCGEPAIIKGKKEYGGGWLCFQRKGGCGAKFKDGDPEIENQNMGRVEYENPADYYNTCLKIAKKRSLTDGTLSATAASDMFTQDLDEDDLPPGLVPDPDAPPPEPPVKAPQRASKKSGGGNTVTGQVDSVIVKKSGEKNGKEWHLYTVTVAGVAMDTFHETAADIAKDALEVGAEVTAVWNDGKYGKELDSIDPA